MSIINEIENYINSQPEPRRGELATLHKLILQTLPGSQLWFFDGKNSEGKIVSNPNIGYGHQLLRYADGKTKEFYQIGVSGTATGISIYVLGLADNTWLARTLGKKLDKCTITGYCIKFKKLNAIDVDHLMEAIRMSVAQLKSESDLTA